MHSSSRIRGLSSYTCEERYSISYSSTNTRTALYIIGLLILTVVLEVAVHKDLEEFEGYFSTSKSATKADEETANLDDDNNGTVSMIDQQLNPYQQLLLSTQQQDTAKPKDTAQRISNFCLPSPPLLPARTVSSQQHSCILFFSHCLCSSWTTLSYTTTPMLRLIVSPT
jgi:hypothetical protein